MRSGRISSPASLRGAPDSRASASARFASRAWERKNRHRTSLSSPRAGLPSVRRSRGARQRPGWGIAPSGRCPRPSRLIARGEPADAQLRFAWSHPAGAVATVPRRFSPWEYRGAPGPASWVSAAELCPAARGRGPSRPPPNLSGAAQRGRRRRQVSAMDLRGAGRVVVRAPVTRHAAGPGQCPPFARGPARPLPQAGGFARPT